MNSLQNLIQRLSAIGQVNEEEAKKPDADKDGIPDWADKDDKEKVEEAKKSDADGDDEDYDDSGPKDHYDPNSKPHPKGHLNKLLRKKLDEPEVKEGAMDSLKAMGKKALDTLGHGDDEDLIKDMQKKAGLPQTGKKPGQEEEVKETALNLLRRYAGIQEAKIKEDDVEEGNEFSGALQKAKATGQEEFEVAGKKYKVNECGDMSMGNEMSPMTAVANGEPHMGIPAQVMAQMSAPEQGPEMDQPEMSMAEPEAPKAQYTLNITNGDNNLSMTTDMPDEIIHIMKLAGVNQGAEVTKKEMPADGEQEVEESGYENTPDNTKARDPQAHGDIRDWGQKGTANAKTHYTPAKSGDNPMNEQRMFDDYKNFKAGK
jgi:hypothetical protein